MDEKVIKISKKRIFGAALLLFLAVTLGWYITANILSEGLGFRQSEVLSVPSAPAANYGPMGRAMDALMPGSSPMRYPIQGGVDATDTRSFMKMAYSALFYTRDVREVVDAAEGRILAAEGRIDTLNKSEMYGVISFVVAKDKFEGLRGELEGLVHVKLYDETISSQNLLGQKQNIETRTNAATTSLAELETTLANVESQYNAKLSKSTIELNKMQRRLDEIRSLLSTTDKDSEAYNSLIAEDAVQVKNIAQYRSAMSAEAATYGAERNRLQTQLAQANTTVTALEDEDQDFVNNVETVNGTLTVRKVSWWALGERFSPTPMWLNTFIVILAGMWVLRRRKILPRVELV